MLPGSDVAQPLALRFAEHYPKHGAGFAPAFASYDALYLLAYALAATPLSPSPTSAQSVEHGFRQVTEANAEHVDVGPGPALERAEALLAAGLPFDTFGTSGPARFDLERYRGGTLRAYCWDADGALNTVARYDDDGTTIVRDVALASACGDEVLRASDD
jgi:hypothetical protein